MNCWANKRSSTQQICATVSDQVTVDRQITRVVYCKHRCGVQSSRCGLNTNVTNKVDIAGAIGYEVEILVAIGGTDVGITDA